MLYAFFTLASRTCRDSLQLLNCLPAVAALAAAGGTAARRRQPARVAPGAFFAGCWAIAVATATAAEQAKPASATDYPTIQAAINANPGAVVLVPPGRYEIDQPLQITADGVELIGHGTIVQTNPEAHIVEIHGADQVRLESLTLVRRGHAERMTRDGVRCIDSTNVTLDRLRVYDNKSQGAAIRISRCENATVQDCQIVNYKCVGVDDRTRNNLQGYAFHCIDGNGVAVSNSVGTVIRDNRIIERDILPTREMRDAHQLGQLTEGSEPTRLGELGRRAVHNNHTPHWHQGSAIVVSGPTVTRHTQILGNYIENAAQGVDMHCDQTICSNNVVNRAKIGLKATHGSSNLLMDGNLLRGIDLWAIVLNPGAGSHWAEPATDDRPSRPANVDGGIVISNNMITDYGEGNDYWRYGGAHSDLGSSYAIAILQAQLETNPPLSDVLVVGNMVYDATQDATVDRRDATPKYRYAVRIEQADPLAQKLYFAHNRFHPGRSGVSNVELPAPPQASP